MSLKIAGLKEVAWMLKDIPKQSRFAAMKTCNRVAVEVQKKTLEELPAKFTLRSRGTPWYRPGNKLGFNIKFANRNNMEATIGTRAEFMQIQETGGAKPNKGHRFAIPDQARPTLTTVISKRNRPRPLLEKKGFVLNGALMVRTKGIIKRMYQLVKSAVIKPRLGFRVSARKIVDNRFSKVFSEEFKKAMATRK